MLNFVKTFHCSQTLL